MSRRERFVEGFLDPPSAMPPAEEGPKLEYNLAGGLALTVRERDFRSLCEGLVNSGYRYACVLPFRSLTKDPFGLHLPFLEGRGLEDLKGCPIKIVHLEPAWNPTSHESLVMASKVVLVEEYKRYRGQQFKYRAWDALFPGEITCEKLFHDLIDFFPDSKFISHKMELDFEFPENRLLVEVNPGIEKSAQEIIDEAGERKLGLVFDPSHLLASDKVISVPREPTKPYKGEWEKQFLTFANQIEVVDINPPKPDDVQDLLQGRGLLKELAQAAKESGGVKFLRVEIQIPPKLQIPGLPSHQKGCNFLQVIGQRLMEG